MMTAVWRGPTITSARFGRATNACGDGRRHASQRVRRLYRDLPPATWPLDPALLVRAVDDYSTQWVLQGILLTVPKERWAEVVERWCQRIAAMQRRLDPESSAFFSVKHYLEECRHHARTGRAYTGWWASRFDVMWEKATLGYDHRYYPQQRALVLALYADARIYQFPNAAC